MAKKEIKYSEAMEELNGILEGLQSDSVDVDEVSVKVKRAVELIKIAREKIEKTEFEVKKIVKEFDAEQAKAE
jgi:exodeoxyribonuclease VII small subunit